MDTRKYRKTRAVARNNDGRRTRKAKRTRGVLRKVKAKKGIN